MHPVSAREIAQAAQWLAAGELVAFPTETVYGLGADARNPQAVARIYTTKGRPADHPLIVHLAPEANLADWAREISEMAQRLIEAFWPGPLTLILQRADAVPAIVSAGQDSIGLRCPAHPIAQALLRAFQGGQGGIAAPSANRFGHLSPTTAQHVYDEFGLSEDLHVLDGGACPLGIESTIVDVTRGFPALLRPGHITLTQLTAVLGITPRLPEEDPTGAPRASGTLKAHYAPRTPLSLLSAAEIAQALAGRAAGESLALLAQADTVRSWQTLPNLHWLIAPGDPQAYAHNLYQLLRMLDHSGARRILVERPPNSTVWAAVNDRLERAAAAFV
jgi:L-threonylcarbamoyladenylate synthase